MIIRLFSYPIALLLLFNFAYTQASNDVKIKKKPQQKRETTKNEQLELFDKIFNSIENSYVDSINQSEIILSGIKGMLGALDPYTKILMGASKERYEVLARGRYGGVGMSIDEVRDTIIITRVYEDSPSYFEGIMAGDMILKVDTTNVVGLTTSETVKLLKGELDTSLKIKILRRPGKEIKEFVFRRDNITINDVPYWGIDENKIGYVKINKFSKFTSDYFKEAIIEMDKKELKGLIVDLRSNGGGLLLQATNILDFLLKKDLDNPILVRKGRSSERKYFSSNEPIINDSIPIVILQNSRSASASEIVSGVLQDLDRAIVMGQNSFGKGLVQITKTINDSMKLKVTTAKYYLPSGRLIQKYDYLGNGVLTDGLDKQDSIFFSSNGREIKGGNGITPDVLTEKNTMPSFIRSLWMNERLFISFSKENAELITNNSFLAYKKFLEFKYSDDYSLLDPNVFAINIFNYSNYYERLLASKEEEVNLILNIKFLDEILKIYKKISQYQKYQNLTNKNLDLIIEYSIDFKKYLSEKKDKRKLPLILKEYLIENYLYYKPLDKNNKKIGDHDLYDILLKLLVIIKNIDLSSVENYEEYLYDINYIDIDNYRLNLDKSIILKKQQNKLNDEVIDWYIKLYYGKTTSPHSNIPINETDISFLDKVFNKNKEKNKLITLFKKYIDDYDFDYNVDGELELKRLKEKLLDLPEFSIDSTSNDNFIGEYIKNRKYSRLIKDLEKFIKKNKKRYFFKEDNMNWIMTSIFREYMKLASDNSSSVRTSLYLDNEYEQAINLFINPNKEDLLGIDSVSKIGE